MLTPKDLKDTRPMASVFHRAEEESTAMRIMETLAKTGNKWRKMTWVEFCKDWVPKSYWDNKEIYERFSKVVEYTTSADVAKLFSRFWKELDK